MSVLAAAGCRIRQAFYGLGRRLRPARRPEVEDGPGAMFAVARIVRSGKLGKPLMVVGPNTSPWDERLKISLEESDVEFAVWDESPQPPTADDAERLRLFWAGEKCGSFIALGGAETIDLVKAAAARAACPGKTVMGMVGSGKVGRRTPAVIAVPTTAGSGAESLAWATVMDEGNRFRIEDPALVPGYVVLDPSLAADVPRPVLAGDIMDGLCLAVEAYLSGYADEKCRASAAEAVAAIFDAAEPCWNSGGTAMQRTRLMTASRLAGEAASAAGGGYARALSRAAEEVTGVPFGEACAVILPIVLEKYGYSAMSALAALAEKSAVCAEGTKAQRAAALIRRIRGLAFRIGLPETLEGLSPEAAAEIADLAAAETNRYWSCPAVWAAEDCGRVLNAVRAEET